MGEALINLGHRCVEKRCEGREQTWSNEALSKVGEDLAGFGWNGAQGRGEGAQYLTRSSGSVRGYDGRSFPVPVQRFYGEGEERTAIRFPAGTGYPNRGSDHWGMVFMLMNHRSASQTVSHATRTNARRRTHRAYAPRTWILPARGTMPP